MSQKHPLHYPAPVSLDKSFLSLPIQKMAKIAIYDRIFGHSMMRVHFKRISVQGVIPIIIGAAVAATGHSQMFVRSLAVCVCAVWLSVDIGIWISETDWQAQWKGWWFCLSTTFLCCFSMGIMYWFLLSTLEDQQNDVSANLKIHAFIPASHNIMDSGITVTNDSGTDIRDHRIMCWSRRIVNSSSSGIGDLGLGAFTPEKSQLNAHGDADTSYCLAPFKGVVGQAVCADITVDVTYSLETQPLIKKHKELRFVTGTNDLEWRSQAVKDETDFCPPVR
jgi:hypothetical protein